MINRLIIVALALLSMSFRAEPAKISAQPLNINGTITLPNGGTIAYIATNKSQHTSKDSTVVMMCLADSMIHDIVATDTGATGPTMGKERAANSIAAIQTSITGKADTGNAYTKAQSDARYGTISIPTINNNVVRALNSNYTIPTTKFATVNYSVQVSISLALSARTGTVTVQYSTNGGSTWISLPFVSTTPAIGVAALTVGLLNIQVLNVGGMIPANANAVRIATTTVTGVTYTYSDGQEGVF